MALENKGLGTGGVLNISNALLKNEGEQNNSNNNSDLKKNPFSPTNTGLPVVIKDKDGNRIGNVWSPNQNGLGEALKSVENGESTKVYYDLKENKFTNHPSSTMTFKNGKISLNVAADVANSSWYKNIFDSQVFKDVASAYAYDPTGKTELEITNKDGSKEKKTINDLLQGFADDLAENSRKYKGNVDTRTNISRLTGGALNLTDEDLDIMGTYQSFSKENFSDTDALFLPDSIKDFFKDYAGYDADSGAISAKDFYEEFFNLNNDLPDSAKEIIEIFGGGELSDEKGEVLQGIGESEKDYAIDLIRTKTSQEMIDIVDRITFYKDDLSDTEKANLATEYAKCFSLYKVMTNDTPNTDSWTGFNLAIQGLGQGIADGAVTAGERIEHFWSEVIYSVLSLGMQVPTAIDGVVGFLHDVVGNFFEGGIDKVNENFAESQKKFEEAAEKVYGEGTMLNEMKQSILDVGEAIDNRTDLAAQLFESAEYDLAYSYANTEAMLRIGKISGIILTQVLVTNPIGETVGNLASLGIAEGLSVGLTGYRFATLMNMSSVFSFLASTANTASMATKYLRLMNLISKTSSVVGFAANMYTQGVVDTFVENPTLTDALLFNESTKDVSEFQNAIRWNILWNTIGETVPFAGKKGLKWVKNTPFGAVTQAVFRKTVNWFTLPGRKAYEGIAEFMTRKSKEFVIEEGSDAPFSGKLNPEKRWQALRKEIINIQEQIKDTKIFRGDGTPTEQAEKIDELIQKRIDLEEVLGTSKKLAIAQKKQAIIKNAGLDIEVAEVSQYTAELSNLAKKMKQTNMPGTFSKETGDYINDIFNRDILLNKKTALEDIGKSLSKTEMTALDALTARIKGYEGKLPIEHVSSYKQAVKNYMEANYRYYRKLNDFLSSDAGGNIISRKSLDEWRADPRYGANGEMYMPLYAVGGFKGVEDLESLLKDPASIIREGKVKNQVDVFARKMFNPEVTYLDPNYTRDLVTNAYAQVMNAAEMSDAVARAGRATSIPTDSQGNILKTPKDIAKAKNNLYKDLESKFESAFRANRQGLGIMTTESTKVKAKAYYGAMKRHAQRSINDILGLNQAGLKRYASTLNSAEIEQINKVYSLPAYSRKIRTRAELDAMYESLSPIQKKIVDKNLNGGELTVRRWNTAVTDNNLDVSLSRQYVKENKAILQSDFYKNMVGEARAAEIDADEALALREANAKLEQAQQGLKTGELKGTEAGKVNAKKTRDFNKTIRGTITEAVDETAESLADNPYLEQLIKEYEKNGISSDMAKQYIIYQWLYDNAGKNGVLQDIAFRYYNAPSRVSNIKISTDSAKGFSAKFQKAAGSIVESKLNKIVAKIQEEGTEGLVDLESTSKRVEEYFKDITDLWGEKRLVEAWDRELGQFKYYKVDHSTYNLVTNYPTFKKNNLFARTMARINSISRFGQIIIRAASLVTQGFKDSFNAIILGGWDQLLLDNPTAYKKIAEYIGPDVVDAFRKEMTPNAWKDFLAQAEWQGLSVEEAIAKSEVNSELLNLKIEGGSGTSASYFSYRSLYEPTDETALRAATQIQAAKDTWKGETKVKWKDAYKRAREEWYKQSYLGGSRNLGDRLRDYTNFLHNAREKFLRRQVYRQNFMDALSYGKSLPQARNYAQYVMDNATTNFARGFAWGNNIIRSIPYFGAMLNGASSMVRLLEIDPLGIMIRFNTDLVIPVIGLTAMSLEDPQDAEIYKNIPEWEKEGNLHWVVNGQVYTIPLPEELAKFILPIRHTVESIAGANDNAWHELLLNDLLNMPTIPLNAVMMLDEKKINADPSIGDRISALGMDLFNTLAPNAARTMYIATTGKDPYTGENYGRVKMYQDANGEYQYMTESEYGFANDMAELFKSWGWGDVSAIMAEALFSSFFGAGSLDLAEGVRDFAVSAQEGSPDITALLSPSMERAGNVMTGTARTDKEQANIAWYSLVNNIKEKKKEVLASDGKLAKYAQDIDMAKDQETLAKKTELYNAEVRNYQDIVMGKVKQYTEQYGDYFDRPKFAATLSMLTTQLSIDDARNSDQYYNARALAVETMYNAGFRSPSDNSVFGYVYRDMNSGKVGIKYTDPLIISLSENLMWYQGDEAVQMMEDTIELSGLKEKYNNEIYPAYNQYMKKKDYTSANKLAAAWDVELMKELKPIIDQYTVGELLGKSTAVDLLDNYIIVPNTKDAMGKGMYYSSSTGLNKRRGYAQSYVKKIYKALQEDEK